ncbi:MAG: hypothetical protein HZB41_00750 [Ignavibacteriae bacterium]|nr:hypothetical protein [Ignavibacteriota bacterium]
MKIITFLLLSFFLYLSSCSDTTNTNSNYTESNGVIIGYDYAECACCGGWFVDMNKDTLRIWNMPVEFNKILGEKELPVNMKLSWKKMTEGCGTSMKDIILVNSINLR